MAKRIFTKKNRKTFLVLLAALLLLFSRRRQGNYQTGYLSGNDRIGNGGNNGGNNPGGSNGGNNPGGGDGGTDGGTLYENPAVFSATAAGSLYEWLGTENVDLEIKPDGKVKLLVPESKKSFNGANDCFPFFLDGNFCLPLTDTERAAFLGDGLEIPEGDTTIIILYCAASSQSEITNINKYYLVPGLTGQADQFSANAEYIIISRTPEAATSEIGEIRVPLELRRASWLAVYHFLNFSLGNPSANGYGITRYYVGNNVHSQFGKHFTHIQKTHEWIHNEVDQNRWWLNRRALPVGLTDTQYAEQETRNPQAITFSQITEDFATGDPGYSRSQNIGSIYYNIVKNENPGIVNSPADTGIYWDYFSPIHGGTINIDWGEWSATEELLKEGLATQTNSKKRAYDGELVSSSYDWESAWRNILHPGYFGNFLQISPENIYSLIYNLEKYNIAYPDRKVGMMTWIGLEGLGQDLVVERGVNFRLPLGENKEILRASTLPVPWATMFTNTLYFYLLSNRGDVVLWDSNLKLNVNPHTFAPSWYGGDEDWKTKYRDENGNIVTWDPNNPTHPQSITGADNSQFPELPQHSESGAFAARMILKTLTEDSDYISHGLYYYSFQYRTNTGSWQNGYRSGASPIAPNGARLSARGYSNPGNHIIVETGKDHKPICIKMQGESGTALLLHNPYSSISTITEFLIDGNTYSVKGATPKILTI